MNKKTNLKPESLKSKASLSTLSLTLIFCLALFLVLLGFSGGYFMGQLMGQHRASSTDNDHDGHGGHQHHLHSKYAGQESQGIKALLPSDIEGIKNGSGTPFGGMAKAAELNGYPGPRHVLDAYLDQSLSLSPDEYAATENLFQEMKKASIEIGEKLIEAEKELDRLFKDEAITPETLEKQVSKSADLYGKLRANHLYYHLSMKELLTPEQIAKYNQLRGYAIPDKPNKKSAE